MRYRDRVGHGLAHRRTRWTGLGHQQHRRIREVCDLVIVTVSDGVTVAVRPGRRRRVGQWRGICRLDRILDRERPGLPTV